jgi:hypothetical protein
VFVVELLSGCVALRSALWRAPDRCKLHWLSAISYTFPLRDYIVLGYSRTGR